MNRLSTLTRAQLKDRIRGCIFGNAVGDAYGLATEFMLKSTARTVYGNGPIAFGTDPGYPVWEDYHRSIEERNDFTDDTDQLLLMLQSFEQTHDGTLHSTNFSKKLSEWVRIGFPELGTPARGIGYTVGLVMDHSAFENNPHKAAFDVWDSNGRNLAPNGAVMRTAVSGIESFWDEQRVVRNTLAAAKVTHADPRSIVSALVSAVLISRMLRGGGQDAEEDAARTWNPRIRQSAYHDELLDYLRRGTDLQVVPEAAPSRDVFQRKDHERLERERVASDPQANNANQYAVRTSAEMNQNRPEVILRPNIGWAGIDNVGEDPVLGALARSVIDDYKFLLQRTDIVPNSGDVSPAPFQRIQDKWCHELESSCFPENIEQLDLGSSRAMGYAYKCIGISYYGVTRQVDPSPLIRPDYEGPRGLFRGLMEQVTLEAGDADTNAAVMGSLLGARFGLEEGIPSAWWSGLQHLPFLEETVERFANRVLSNYEQQEQQ